MQRRPLLGLAALGLALPAQSQAPSQAETPSLVHLLQLGAERIELRYDASLEPAQVQDALAWVQRAAGAVVLYLGRLPLARFQIQMQAVSGAGVRGGTAFPEPQPHIRIRVGRDTRRAQFDNDWILVHEMLHLAIPQLARRHRWLHEGIATYAEGAARVLAGMNPAARWWGELLGGLPRGLPQPGDQGLDRTPTWGRTYWGGTLFCLLADVQMRRTGDARQGLREAMQGLMAAGGNYAMAWPIDRVLAVADAAVGQTTLTQLYLRMKDQPEEVDLDALWRELGVRGAGEGLATLQDDAPLSAVRRAIAA